jgi:hypothetical protein
MRLPGLSRGFLDRFAVPGAFPPVLVRLVAYGEGLFPLSDIRNDYSVLFVTVRTVVVRPLERGNPRSCFPGRGFSVSTLKVCAMRYTVY